MRGLGIFRSICILGLLISTSKLAAISYQFTELDGFSSACAINSLGQVVGYSSLPDRAVTLYDRGTYTQLESSGIGSIYPHAINDAGQVVGEARFGGEDRAFLYSGGVVTDLGVFTGGYSSSAADINNKGQIVGNSSAVWTPDDVTTHPAFIVDRGPMQRLAPPRYDFDGFIVESVNNASQVVGWNKWTGNSMILNPDGAMIDIGPGFAREMNDKGQVAGVTSDPISVAWIYENGQQIYLSSLPGEESQSTSVSGINNYGQVVGMSGDKPFLYDGHSLHDLTNLLNPVLNGWTSLSVRDINDSGSIIGAGYTPEGVQRAFLLTPVPEPNSLVLLVACSAAAMQRKRMVCTGSNRG